MNPQEVMKIEKLAQNEYERGFKEGVEAAMKVAVELDLKISENAFYIKCAEYKVR